MHVLTLSLRDWLCFSWRHWCLRLR